MKAVNRVMSLFLLTAVLLTAPAFAQVTLRVATASTDQAGMEALIERYEAENPDVTVNPTYADTDQLMTLMRTQLASGTGPDVFFTWPGNGNAMALAQIGPAGFLADLSDRPWTEDIPPGYNTVTQLDGATYILPMTTTFIGTFYNEDVFEAQGVEPPTTWTGMLELCDTLNEAGIIPIVLGNQTSWVTQLVTYAIVPSTVFADDPDFASAHLAGETSFPDSGWAEALNKYMELEERGCFNDDPNATPFEQSLRMVASGEAAMVVQVSAVLNQLRDFNPDASFTMFPFPAVDDPEAVWIPAAAGVAYGVNADSRNLEEALAFIDFLGQPEIQNLNAEVSGALPALPNDQYNLDPALAPMVGKLSEGKTAPFMDQLWPNARVQQVHLRGVQELFSGQTTVEELLEEMERAFDEN